MYKIILFEMYWELEQRIRELQYKHMAVLRNKFTTCLVQNDFPYSGTFDKLRRGGWSVTSIWDYVASTQTTKSVTKAAKLANQQPAFIVNRRKSCLLYTSRCV